MSLSFNSHVALLLLVGLSLLYLLNIVRLLLFNPLRSIPGPLLSRVSGVYKLSLVATGRAPQSYRQVHKHYGKIVRVAPNHVSISDPAEIPTIYGLGSKFLKTPFYSTMTPFYKGQSMDSMFTERDPSRHKALKTPVAQLFSMTHMRNYEPHADECTHLFEAAMHDLQGQPLDLAVWLQWYAFDVIGSITFQRRFGFLERRTDIDNMIGNLDSGLTYVGLVSQYPALHPWLMGNRTLLNILHKLIPNIPDPLARFLDITEHEVRRYDEQRLAAANDGSPVKERTDFLAQLRAKETKDGKISQRDMMNHLSNNLLAGSDTTAISLRACFYYIIKTPRVYARLQQEIDAADRAGGLSSFVTYQESLQLPYLQATIKEALRLHPGVGFPLERYVPSEGVTLCKGDTDTFLPGGTIVSVSAPVVHADTAIFGANALEFRPERWLPLDDDENGADKERLRLMERSFLSFGYGARTCIGKNISLLEMGKFVPQMLRHFEIAWAGDRAEWNTHTAWFWKQSGIMVRFTKRPSGVSGGWERPKDPKRSFAAFDAVP